MSSNILSIAIKEKEGLKIIRLSKKKLKDPRVMAWVIENILRAQK